MPRKPLDDEGRRARLKGQAGTSRPGGAGPRLRQPDSTPSEAHRQADRGINATEALYSF